MLAVDFVAAFAVGFVVGVAAAFAVGVVAVFAAHAAVHCYYFVVLAIHSVLEMIHRQDLQENHLAQQEQELIAQVH